MLDHLFGTTCGTEDFTNWVVSVHKKTGVLPALSNLKPPMATPLALLVTPQKGPQNRWQLAISAGFLGRNVKLNEWISTTTGPKAAHKSALSFFLVGGDREKMLFISILDII